MTGTDVALGKPQGSDERHGKVTYVSRYGLDGARAMAAESHRNARAALDRAAPGRAEELDPDHRLHRHQDFMTSLLSRIDRPQDLHALSEDELQAVAQEVRELLIDTVGEIGGHFGANLGTCEIAVALHSLMDSPRDKILWDVGHQAYPHKILTGRRDELGTIRHYGGLAPFCSIAESEHDIMGAGHASTSIGYAVGIKEAMLRGGTEDGKVVAVIGDGAMTGGVAFEAVSQAGGLGTPMVVILNDNGMSIAPNVGALSRYMNRVRLDPGLWEAREGVEEKLTKLPAGIGAAFERLGPRFKESVKAFWAPGPVVGRARLGLPRRRSTATTCARCAARCGPRSRPSAPSSSTARRSRARASRPPRTAAWRAWRSGMPRSRSRSRRGVPRRRGPSSPAPPQYTQVFGEAMVRECERDPRVIGITAAMNSGTGLSILQKAMPDRYFDVGIAEQQGVLFAAGMALSGMRPVAAIYSTFLQRAFDQIVHDVCLQNLPVTFCMDRAGLVGDDGPTHHGVFDIAYLRSLPNMTLMAPRDEAMLVHMLHTAMSVDGPAAIRYPRGAGVGVEMPDVPSLLTRRHGRDPARGRARGADRLRHRRRQGARRRGSARPSVGWTSPSSTRASASRWMPRCWRRWPPSTSCS